MERNDLTNGTPEKDVRVFFVRVSCLLALLLLTGAVHGVAQIQTSVPSLSGFIQTNTIPCPSQSYVVSATNISSDVDVTAPAGFEISEDQITWIAPPAFITIGQSGPDSILHTTIYVRLNTLILGDYAGNIMHTATGAPPHAVAVTGVRSAKSPTTTSLVSLPNPSVFGQSVTMTASVTSPLSGTPTGTVTFFDGPTSLGSASLNISAIASLSTSALTFGSHTLTATYNADATFDASTSSGESQFVQGTTTTLVISNNNPSVAGQSVTFTATVSSSFPGTPTGSVTFFDGVSSLGSILLTGGSAALSTSGLAPGSHAITASYAGDVSFAASTSPVLSQAVKAVTTTGLVSDHNPSVSGQLVTLTATVGSVTPGTITGTVTFFDGASPIGVPVAVAGGTAARTGTYAASGGSHSFTATFNGDASYAGSTSSVVLQTVNKASSAAAIVGVPNPSAPGQSVTFMATVSAVAPGSGTPTGSVTFSVDGSPFGPVSMSGGVASMATSSLALGLHTIIGSYSGDGDFNSIISSAYPDTVDPVITATAGPHGSISPSGLVLAPYGGNQVFLITPATGYHVDSVFVDDLPVDSTTSYTFFTVTANHTIRASFVINRYTITASAGPNGAIAPVGAASADYGTSPVYTITPDAGYHVDSLLVDGVKVDSTTSYTFVNVAADHTIRAAFRINVSPKFLTVTPDTIIAKDPVKGKLLKPVKRFKNLNPNWANLLDETVAQGGFQPGSSESDSVGGMVVGRSFMENVAGKWKVVKDSAKVRAWVRLTKWDFKKSMGKSFNALQKTLEDKTGRHDLLPARGFDLTTDGNSKVLKGQITSLTPKKQDNILYAELVALKLNIAASALGKTPAGLGELIFGRDTSAFDGMTVKQIAGAVDQMMTYWQLSGPAAFADAYQTVHDINRAFVAPFDTASFNVGGLVLKGLTQVGSVPFLKTPTPFVATRLEATTTEYESGEENDFEDQEFDESLTPVAAKLYQNYPNPFNPGTMISFRLLEASQVTVRIYNTLGQEVAVLLTGEELEEGFNEVRFDAGSLSSGVYFYHIDAQGLGDAGLHSVVTNKMILLK
jgi:hypothetical protein